MKTIHVPSTFQEVIHSPVTLVSGTALISTMVIVAYSFMKNAEGEVLLDVAAENLVSWVQIMFA